MSPAADDDRERADALVLFGITGDLAQKMLLPALYRLTRQGFLRERIVGVTRGGWSQDRLRAHAHDAVAAQGPVDEREFDRFAELLRLATVDYDTPGGFRSIAEQTADCRYLAHYLAIPPALYATAARRLAEAGLNERARLAVEKPFGHDLESARELLGELTRCFPEERLRLVDHFLGKDAVTDLLTVRTANTLLDAVLDRRRVRGVQLTLAEDFGVADRGGFYDATGCLRDVVQNHLLQTLSYLLMECPESGATADLLDARARALRAVRTVRPEDYVRGQYAGYAEVPGVRPGSTTETYSALRLHVDSERWSGVPLTIRSGKELVTSALEIIVELSRPGPDLYRTRDDLPPGPDLIRFPLSPRTGIGFDLLAQCGEDPTVVGRVAASTEFPHLSGDDTVAYEHVLAGVITGDPRRFARMDMVEECWRIVADILDPAEAPFAYAPGTWGPAEADRLALDGRWVPLEAAGG